MISNFRAGINCVEMRQRCVLIYLASTWTFLMTYSLLLNIIFDYSKLFIECGDFVISLIYTGRAKNIYKIIAMRNLILLTTFVCLQDKFMACLEPQQLDIDTSDLSNGTLSKAFKFAKTRLKVSAFKAIKKRLVRVKLNFTT